ncbi:MAG TPA: nuclear transport factor 2 family protein [Myxococcales bacterium]|nr:nuclear transport factor 2 family protein [Myxococcales bacterium]
MRLPAVLLVMAAACAHASATVDQKGVEAELDDFHDAAARADEERYFAHFAPDGVFLGTDATERWNVAAFRAYAHPYFACGKAWSLRAVRRAVTVRGEVAWFDEDLETENLGPARGSGVLSLRDGRWLVEQYVLSITIPNDRFPAVRDLLKQRSR